MNVKFGKWRLWIVRSEEGSQAERKTCLTEEVIKARKKSGDFGTTKTDGGACRSPELTDLMPRVGYILTSYLKYSIVIWFLRLNSS